MSSENIGPAENACREFEERTAGWGRNGERLEVFGRRRWNLAERLEYIRLQLNEIHERESDEDWDNISGMAAILFVREYLDKFDYNEWARIDEERALEDMEGA